MILVSIFNVLFFAVCGLAVAIGIYLGMLGIVALCEKIQEIWRKHK